MRKTKEIKPIVFEKLSATMYRCRSESDPFKWYNVAIIADGKAMCCCLGASRHGANGCKHAKALVEQGLAVRPAYFCDACLDTGVDIFQERGMEIRRCKECNGSSALRSLY